MNPATKVASLLHDARYLGPAVVTEDERPDGRVLIRLDLSGPGPLHAARVAVPRTVPLAAGREVLVAGDPDDRLYVIGVLGAPEPDTAPRARLETSTGAYAARAGSGETAGEELLRVYSPRHELLFEYDPVRETSRVNVTRGSLDLVAEDGDINLKSARNVRIEGDAIDMSGRSLTVKTSQARWIVERLETLAGTLVEKAKNAYRSVEQLAQLRTGRMRTLVDETYQFKSKRAFLKSEEDFKIKADQIHLG